MERGASPALEILPVTPARWPLLEDLFESGGACKECWCMYWRIGPAYQRRPAAENRSALFQIVQSSRPPGLLAIADGKAIGWCQVTPRSELPKLEKTPRLKPIDERPVWCVSCFYIRKGHRRKGVTQALLKAAIDFAKQSGGQILEGYPIGSEKRSMSYTGFVSTFSKLGFQIVAQQSRTQPIMRLAL